MNLIATPAQPEKVDLGSLGIINTKRRGSFETPRVCPPVGNSEELTALKFRKGS
jgi:hypothetical protein